MEQKDIQITVDNLNKAYPNGWRSGDPTCDALTVYLANGLRQMCEVIFQNPIRRDQ